MDLPKVGRATCYWFDHFYGLQYILFKVLTLLFNVCFFGWIATKLVGLRMQTLLDTTSKWKHYASPGSMCAVGACILVQLYFLWKTQFPSDKVENLMGKTLFEEAFSQVQELDLACTARPAAMCRYELVDD